MSYVFRNRFRKYDKVSDMVSGVVNYRMMNISTQTNNNFGRWC